MTAILTALLALGAVVVPCSEAFPDANPDAFRLEARGELVCFSGVTDRAEFEAIVQREWPAVTWEREAFLVGGEPFSVKGVSPGDGEALLLPFAGVGLVARE